MDWETVAHFRVNGQAVSLIEFLAHLSTFLEDVGISISELPTLTEDPTLHVNRGVAHSLPGNGWLMEEGYWLELITAPSLAAPWQRLFELEAYLRLILTERGFHVEDVVWQEYPEFASGVMPVEVKGEVALPEINGEFALTLELPWPWEGQPTVDQAKGEKTKGPRDRGPTR